MVGEWHQTTTCPTFNHEILTYNVKLAWLKSDGLGDTMLRKRADGAGDSGFAGDDIGFEAVLFERVGGGASNDQQGFAGQRIVV